MSEAKRHFCRLLQEAIQDEKKGYNDYEILSDEAAIAFNDDDTRRDMILEIVAPIAGDEQEHRKKLEDLHDIVC